MKKGTDVNKDNDIALRKGLSAVYKHNKQKTVINNAISDPEIKDALMDFIFGKIDKSPLENIRKGF